MAVVRVRRFRVVRFRRLGMVLLFFFLGAVFRARFFFVFFFGFVRGFTTVTVYFLRLPAIRTRAPYR